MKNSNLFLVFLINTLILLTFNSCKEKSKNTIDLNTTQLIFIHTQGQISIDRFIYVVFAEDIDIDAIKAKPQDYFKITPKTEGEYIWSGKRTIKFKPKKLEFNTSYNVAIDMKMLFPNQEVNTFSFQFKTVPLYINLKFDNLYAKNSKEFVLKGFVNSNSKLSVEKMSNIISTEYDGDEKPKVEFTEKNNQIEFTISNLKKGDTQRVLKVIWDGSSIGSNRKGSSRFFIPQKSIFKVLESNMNPNTPNSVKLVFSSPLKRNQELSGLIYIKGIKSKPKYTNYDNIVEIEYSENISGEKNIIVEKGVTDIDGKSLTKKYSDKIFFTSPSPALKLVGEGVITPDNGSAKFSFEAINLKAVDLEIRKIYSNNIMQFLQNNNLDNNYIMPEVGDIVLAKKIDLADEGENIIMNKWRKYAIDLSKFIKLDKGAIYNVRLGFRKIYSDYKCEENHDEYFKATGLNIPPQTSLTKYKSFWRNWYSYEGYEWEQEKNPCYPAYYTSDNFIQKNILSSNIGLSVKKSKTGSLMVFANDLISSKPMANVKFQVFTYAQQLISEKKSNKNGIAFFDFKTENPAFVIAAKDNDYAYLHLRSNKELSISEFDISGKPQNKGVDGFIYGERGVWRPGDTLFINFILNKKDQEIPDDYPVSFELINPFGKSYLKKINSNPVGQIYRFTCKTNQSDPTGNWIAKVSIGNKKFTKKIKIETIKPNRLKIKVDFKNDILSLSEEGKIIVKWLNGLPASGAKARINTILRSKKTTFKGYQDFVFDDKARHLNLSEKIIFDNKLDENGEGSISLNLDENALYSGMLNADFKIKAFEKSGDFSSDYFSKTISPYNEYVGINFPKSQWGGHQVKINKNNTISIAVLSKEGNPIANRKVKVGLYNAHWRWWWDNNNRDIANYLSDVSIGSFKEYNIKTDSKGIATINVNISDYGAYLLRACDTESEHCSSVLFYSGYYGGGSKNKDFANKLKFQVDKSDYNIGEKAKISIPSGKGNRVLIAIESDGKIEQTTWQISEKDIFDFNIDIEPWMFPNAYVHVSVFRPLSNNTDVSVRRYGIIPLKVKNKDREILPIVTVPDVIEPNENYTIKVSEKNNRPMSYTISIVDEGLLDLTHFKTPSPYDYFFAKRASGIHSWDVYNYLLDSSPGYYDKIISIGGDDGIVSPTDGKKANRFKPAVTSIGPFYLEKGKTAKHNLKMQNYSGAVRVMVISANSDAYGSFEKSIPVKSELMLLPTAPRVISPGETFELPITVFCTSEKIHNVDVVLKTNELFEVIGVKNTNLHFDKPGEKLAYFNVKAKEKIGIGKLDIGIKSGRISANQDIEIDVDNPNPYVKTSNSFIVAKDKTKSFNIEKTGMQGTNSALIEISTLPKLEVEKKLRYLLHYPYGCIEQTTSTAFPLVNIGKLIEMPNERIDKINKIIIATIKRLHKFEINTGGMSYWPGNSQVSDWGTNYATHFLLEAQKEGYDVGDLLENQLSYLTDFTSSKSGRNIYDIVNRAYSLMILAKAGKPNRSSMNYIVNNKEMPTLARWYLALAYSYIGDNDIANKLYNKDKNTIDDYIDVYYTYGSSLRDYSVKLLLLKRLGKTNSAAELTKDIVIRFNKGWHNTQTTAYTLIALSDYIGENSSGMKFILKYDNKTKEINTKKPISTVKLDESEMGNTISIQNQNQNGVLYINTVAAGKPLQYTGTSESKNLKMTISYIDNNGKSLDINKMKMGQEFKAVVNVRKDNSIKDFRNMVVHQIFPSGWEILNWRMGISENKSYVMRYQDIRDDRVYSFFDLGYNNMRIEIPLVATYAGRFYMPFQFAESMYDNTIYARKPGKWIEIVR